MRYEPTVVKGGISTTFFDTFSPKAIPSWSTHKAMISGGDAKTSCEVVDDREQSRLPEQVRPNGSDQAHYWDHDEQINIQLFEVSVITVRVRKVPTHPVDMLVPVVLCNLLVRDVGLLGIKFAVAVRLFGAGRLSLCLLWCEVCGVFGRIPCCWLMGRHDVWCRELMQLRG